MTFYFGLNISRNLTDISNSTEALANLKLDIKDLDRIRGLTDPGNVTRTDFQGLSGLDVDFETEVASLNSETSTYNILTSNTYDSNSSINNNLIVNGQFGAASIKYLYVDNAGLIKAADISTSRLSSWSAFDTPVTNTSPIFYGGEIALGGNLELSSLTLNKSAEAVRFESEIPTHKIRVTIDGQPVDLYAMKGLPLIFRGFFRNANISAIINVLNGLRPSWTIKNVENNIEYVYENRLSSTTSTVSFNDTSARERDISLYYPIDRITQLSLPSINLVKLPSVTLPNLTTLDIQNNDIREFPNLSTFNNLLTLDIRSNNLTRADEDNLKILNSNITARLPSSIRNLYLGNCFSGESSADFSSFSNLVVFDINAGGRINRRLSGVGGVAPNVPTTITDYNIQWNLFNRLPTNVMASQTLKNLYIDYNNINQNDLTIASPELVNFYSDSNSHNLVDVAGKQNLVNYVIYTPSISGNRTITSTFNGCSSLKTVSVRYSPVNGNFPPFINCNTLTSVDFEGTQISGASSNQMIAASTFDSCRNTLSFLRLTSSFITPNQQFATDCFRLMPALDYVLITSNGQGLSGNLPDFSTARNIRYILLYTNQLTGNIPNFDNNMKLFYLHLYNNRFTGAVPNISSGSFQHLLLANNLLDTWNELNGTNLVRIHLQYNRLPRIPNLSNLSNLQELFINNQALSGGGVRYSPGSFVGLRNLRFLNNSNNDINQGDINQILVDLNENYDSNPRGGVSINLRGNSAPSQSEEIQTIITKLRSAGWTIQVN
jgi:hypothetical protein